MVPGRHIFISYPHQLRLQAGLLRWSLHQQGFPVWMDRPNLPAGAAIDDTIRQAILTARAVVVIVAPGTAASEYVQFEWSCAQAASIPVIPISWGAPAPLPPPWEGHVSLSCPEDGSDLLVEQILGAIHAFRRPTFCQPHDLVLVSGEDCRSRLITKLATRHALDLGLKVWSYLESRLPGFESDLQLKEVIAHSRTVALVLSALSASSPVLRRAAGLAFGQHKSLLTLRTEAGLPGPWPFLGDKKYLDFSGDFETAWPSLQQALPPPVPPSPPSTSSPSSSGFPPPSSIPTSFVQPNTSLPS